MKATIPRRGALTRGRAAILLAALSLLAGCGSGVTGGSRARASEAKPSCPETVMATLAAVLGRVYREGLSSERTASAEHMIERSAALRTAIETGNAGAARAAAKALIATGHLTNLQVTTGAGRKLVDLGGAAVAPLRGRIDGAAGQAIATYVTTVWSDRGFIAEGTGLAEGLIALRAGGHSVGASLELPRGALAPHGTLTRGGIVYQYDSLPAKAYPSGSPIEIYVLKTVPATEPLCGASPEDTQLNTLERLANQIYDGERGPRTLVQVRRVQRNQALLQAVAAHDPVGVRKASEALLHHHLVRLRVNAGGKLLGDLGGPYVLAPVHAELRLHGRRIGTFVLSIQDDEGYLRLTRRLVGLRVLMYMNGPDGSPRLVKNSLGPGIGGPQSVPVRGPYTYKNQRFRVFTVNAEAFPSGPLTVRVLVPMPYS